MNHLLFCLSWCPSLSQWSHCHHPAAPHKRPLSSRSGHQSLFQSHVGPLYNCNKTEQGVRTSGKCYAGVQKIKRYVPVEHIHAQTLHFL